MGNNKSNKMKAYIALAIVALCSQSEVSAVQLKQQVTFVDDIVKALAEAEKADENAPAPPKKEEKKPEPPKDAKKDYKKKEEKKNDDEVPMDTAAIKAYSSVIADAAEDSEPSTPV